MGASTSSTDNGDSPTLEGLIEEANRLLSKATEVITQTVESEIGELSDLHQRAATKVRRARDRRASRPSLLLLRPEDEAFFQASSRTFAERE